ncbi:PepSY-like domain-containing protein [Flavobacterium sp. LS1R49]|uniref:PepSY-like domain-containing protein n=1 Tax=Flavobacterium shii TaxID=2987687 RepID=A0A9X2ZF16_9FLAO|nr:PepSY-like domain-containing protein [Flavobacterium shii]MCV9928597.1 PepSY-like domain-containing protein [Flavobacterium shii]
MKKLFFVLTILYGTCVIGQSEVKPNQEVVPPIAVTIAFQKEFSGKVPTWSMDYEGEDLDHVRYLAKFSTGSSVGLAVYDNNGVLKAYELAIPQKELPKAALSYIKSNYPNQDIKEAARLIDGNNVITYEVGIIKNGKFLDVVFDKKGNFIEVTEKN